MVPAEYDLLLGDEAVARFQPRVFDVASETETGDALARVGSGHRPDRGRGDGADEAGKLAQPLAQYVAAVGVVTREHLVAAVARQGHLDVLACQPRQIPGG